MRCRKQALRIRRCVLEQGAKCTQEQVMPNAFSVDTSNRPAETWDDPRRGTLHWRTLMSAGLTQSRSIVCGIAEIAPGEHFAIHSHAEDEVYFGLEGEGIVMVDDIPHRLAPGIALFIPGHARHGVPECQAPMRWFYTFATDSFDQIQYNFAHETGETRTE
jgi:mannose-6-phosphate isomerase-like protein (cupin superfamily)